MVTFGRAATAAGELFELIDRQSRINPFDDSGDKPTTTTGSLELRDIVFSYPSCPDTRVLNGYSLSVPAGKVTALVVSSLSLVQSFFLPLFLGFQRIWKEYHHWPLGKVVCANFRLYQV